MLTPPSTFLFVSPNPEKLKQALSLLNFSKTGFEVADLEPFTEHLESYPHSEVFLECTELIDTDLLDAIHLCHPNTNISIMHQGQFHQYLGIFASRPWLKNFISCRPEILNSDLQSALDKISEKHRFGLKPYFPNDALFFKVEVADSAKKEDYIQSCLAFLKDHLSSSNHARIGNILDEMMMNMLWDAPRDERGNVLYNHVSRHQRIQLEPHQSGLITIAYHDNTLGISSSDPFGAITLQKIIQYLTKCYQSEQQIGSEGAGAGLGLYMIYNLSENFTINVCPGRCTEFIMIFKMRNTLKKQARQKSFHYYELTE